MHLAFDKHDFQDREVSFSYIHDQNKFTNNKYCIANSSTMIGLWEEV